MTKAGQTEDEGGEQKKGGKQGGPGVKENMIHGGHPALISEARMSGRKGQNGQGASM